MNDHSDDYWDEDWENDEEYADWHEDDWCGYIFEDKTICNYLAVNTCDCCGKSLCAMHYETCCGFCESCPTEDFNPYREELETEDKEKIDPNSTF